MHENTTPKHASRVNPRSPYVFDVRELGRRAGAMREYRRSVPAPAGFGFDIIGVPEGAPLAVDVRLESVTEGVLVTGTVTAPLTGECGRCGSSSGGLQHFSYFQWRRLPSASHSRVVARRFWRVASVFASANFTLNLMRKRYTTLNALTGRDVTPTFTFLRTGEGIEQAFTLV
jgi:hypothetical protein